MKTWSDGFKYFIDFRKLASFMIVMMTTAVQASTPQDAPQGFGADISKPVPQVIVHQRETDHFPVSRNSQKQWETYDQPILHCIPGETTLPSKNNALLSFLFGTAVDTDVYTAMSIKGKSQEGCRIHFSQGIQVKRCLFDKTTLKLLMDALLNPRLFNAEGVLAQKLSSACQTASS